jgi:cell division protein FtsB
MENVDIPQVIKTTAKNMYELLMQLSSHIENLEKENQQLKAENESLRK